MLAYVLKRCLIAVVLVWLVVSLIFAFLHLLPGDPAELLLTSQSAAAPTHAQVEAVRKELGLDRPVTTQYVDYLGGLLHGDLGTSFQDGHAVGKDVVERLPRTVELIILACLVAVVIGVPLGVWAATHEGRAPDVLVAVLTSAGISIPVFVVGTLLIYVLALLLHLLPVGGYTDLTLDPVQHFEQAILPVVALSLSPLAAVARMARSAVLDVLGQDWVRTAKAKGMSRRRVLLRHVVRNSLSPVVTVLGLRMGEMLGGTVLVETVFNWPGISSLLVTGASARDYPEVQGLVIVIATLFILLNVIVDIAYGFLDPRVEYR